MARFKVGDRVERVGTGRLGKVVEIYDTEPTHQGETHTQYGVQWDDVQYVERHYLDVGLKCQSTQSR